MRMIILAAAVALSACTAQQEQNVAAKANAYQVKIAAACTTAMSLAALAPSIAPWIVQGCASEAAVAKLALNPSSLDWLNGLIAKAAHA